MPSTSLRQRDKLIAVALRLRASYRFSRSLALTRFPPLFDGKRKRAQFNGFDRASAMPAREARYRNPLTVMLLRRLQSFLFSRYAMGDSLFFSRAPAQLGSNHAPSKPYAKHLDEQAN